MGGVTLGRPVGRKSRAVKLSGRENEIQELLEKNVSKSAIARILGVRRTTVDLFLKGRMVDQGSHYASNAVLRRSTRKPPPRRNRLPG